MVMILLFTVLMLDYSSGAFYLPLKAPVSYCTNKRDACQEEVPIYANRLSSSKTVLTYKYSKFDFCQSEDVQEPFTENLGQTLSGYRYQETPIKLQYLEDVECQEVCTKHYSVGDNNLEAMLNFTKNAIFLGFNHNWELDDVPVTWCYTTLNEDHYCTLGFPVGCYVNRDGIQMDACVINSKFSGRNTYYVFNHLDITITYHSSKDSGKVGQILSASVTPSSRSDGCRGSKRVLGVPGGKLSHDLDIPFTYTIRWVENNTQLWSQRWNYILDDNSHTTVQVFSILNSLPFMLFFGIFVGRILLIAHKRCMCRVKGDIMSKWKMLYGFVFLPPKYAMLLSVFLGSGFHIFLTAYITAAAGSIGLVSRANPGSTLQAALIVFVVMACAAGYMAARFYKTFGGRQIVLQTALQAIFLPGIVLFVFLVVDTIHRAIGSSGAAPLLTHLALFGFWLGSSLLTCIGSFIGNRIGAKPVPCKPVDNEKMPDIPRQSIAQRFTLLFAIAGFGALYIQTYFIYLNLWYDQIYVQYELLFSSLTVGMIMACLVTVLTTHIHLIKKNYRWWWYSFLPVSTTGVYLFLYCMWNLYRIAPQDGVSIAVYLSYSLLASFMAALASGALGLLASFWFVVHIYTAVKKEKEKDEEEDYDPAEKLTTI